MAPNLVLSTEEVRCIRQRRADYFPLFDGCVLQPEDMKALRAILGRRTSFGSLTISWTCGLIFGIYPLLEAEGLQEVDEGLRYIMPDETRFPTILFYDKVGAGCYFIPRLLCRMGDVMGSRGGNILRVHNQILSSNHTIIVQIMSSC